MQTDLGRKYRLYSTKTCLVQRSRRSLILFGRMCQQCGVGCPSRPSLRWSERLAPLTYGPGTVYRGVAPYGRGGGSFTPAPPARARSTSHQKPAQATAARIRGRQDTYEGSPGRSQRTDWVVSTTFVCGRFARKPWLPLSMHNRRTLIYHEPTGRPNGSLVGSRGSASRIGNGQNKDASTSP